MTNHNDSYSRSYNWIDWLYVTFGNFGRESFLGGSELERLETPQANTRRSINVQANVKAWNYQRIQRCGMLRVAI